jgi:hypothetical protein
MDTTEEEATMRKTDDSPAVTPRSLRPVVATLAAAGVPVAGGALHPILGEIVLLVELVVVLTLVGTALFGSLDLSERAFRLLRWIGNRPEPPAPEQAARGASGDAGQPTS